MPTATIVPANYYPPKPGAKSGSIKDSEGNWWGIRPEDHNLIRFGEPVEVQYTEREYQGKVYKNIQRVPNPHSQGAHPGPAPAPKLNGTLTDKDVLLCATGIVKSYIEAGKIDLSKSSLSGALVAARDIVREVFGSNQHADDMNDEIPNYPTHHSRQ